MNTTQKKIVGQLRQHHAATVAELGRDLGLSPADIRHHLAGLLADGLVQAAAVNRPMHRGRPAALFTLAIPGGQPMQQRLLEALLQQALDRRLAGELEQLAAALAEPQPEGKPGSVIRWNDSVARLTELGYSARWEAHAEGPRLTLGECPFGALHLRHPDLCRIDAAALAALLGQPLQQTARREQDLRGLPYCRFQVKE